MYYLFQLEGWYVYDFLCIFTPMYNNYFLGYRVHFSSLLPEDKGYVMGDQIYMPESTAYKFIFMTGVSDVTLKVATDHALQKLNRFIDNII